MYLRAFCPLAHLTDLSTSCGNQIKAFILLLFFKKSLNSLLNDILGQQVNHRKRERKNTAIQGSEFFRSHFPTIRVTQPVGISKGHACLPIDQTTAQSTKRQNEIVSNKFNPQQFQNRIGGGQVKWTGARLKAAITADRSHKISSISDPETHLCTLHDLCAVS